MQFAFTEGQDVMICVKGYKPAKGHVKTASIGGHKGNEAVYWVTFQLKDGREVGLWFSEKELQPVKKKGYSEKQVEK